MRHERTPRSRDSATAAIKFEDTEVPSRPERRSAMIRRKRAKLARIPSVMACSLAMNLRCRAADSMHATMVSGTDEVTESTPDLYISRKGARPSKSAMTAARGRERHNAESVVKAWTW